MKNILTRASLCLIACVCCFVMSDAGTSANITTDSQNYFEKQEEIEGELEIIAECEETSGRTLYFVNTASGRVPLKLPVSGPTLPLKTGSYVRADGNYIGDAFVVSGEIEKLDSDLTTPDLPTTGERRTLVILVNFQDRPIQPFTPDFARNVTFNTTNNFIRENSYGQTWLTGDVYGWFTIPVSSTVCDTLGVSTHALQAAADAGADISAYNHFVFAFPQTMACAFSGASTIGGNPSKVFMNTDWLSLSVLGHEMLHSFGLYHSHSLDCGSIVIGSNCVTSDYGDSFDILGSSMAVHTNIHQKERLGWVQPQLVNASGTYRMDAFETVGGTKGLKILKSIDPVTGERIYYYLEKRTPFGFGVAMANYVNPMNGVTIHIGSDTSGNKSYLLDMTPATASWYDPALTVGQTFTDSEAGVTFTTLSADATGATVNVVFSEQTPVPTDTPTPTATETFTPTTTNTATPTFTPTPTATNTATPTFTPTPTATNTATPMPTATNTATPTFTPTPTVLTVAAVPTQISYTRNQTATVNATVRNGTLPVSGATVVFTMTKANGVVLTATRTTGTNGVATFSYVLSRKKDPTGTYQMRAQGISNGMSGNGNTSFTVR